MLYSRTDVHHISEDVLKSVMHRLNLTQLYIILTAKLKKDTSSAI
jgi:hypothetical protein